MQKISGKEAKNTNLVALSKLNSLFKSEKFEEECESFNVRWSLLWPSYFPEFARKVKFYTANFLMWNYKQVLSFWVGP